MSEHPTQPELQPKHNSDYPVWEEPGRGPAPNSRIYQTALACQVERDQLRITLREVEEDNRRLREELIQAKMNEQAALEQYNRLNRWLQSAQRRFELMMEQARQLKVMLNGEGGHG